MANEVNLNGSDFSLPMEQEAVLAHYFCKNFLNAVETLSATLPDGDCEVLVPVNCLQGLRGAFTKQAQSFTKEKLQDCKAAIDYLQDKGWWHKERPVDTAWDMTDLIQPLLSCESWDWHGAITARILMKWAGLLSIMGIAEDETFNWQEEGLDYLYFMPLASMLEGSPRDHLWNVNMRYICSDAEMIITDKIRDHSADLTEAFKVLCEVDLPQVPTRQTMADGSMVLNRVQVVSAEVKSSSDQNDAGFQ